jgi:4a-hydroxytetrahydrobiopterin dehydratase
MEDLTKKVCIACTGATPKFTPEQTAKYLANASGWEAVENRHIMKKWTFADFSSALARVNTIGDIAESEGHHPDIRFGWGYLEITLSTHEIKGLSENDFILAAKIDQLER